MIEKKTVIDQIEITRNGSIQIRFGLLLVEDGKEIACDWLRKVIEPGDNVAASLGVIDAYLQQTGKAAIDTGRISLVKSVAAIAHTPEVVKAYKAMQEQLAKIK